jgi:hypothetical protein
MAVMVVLVEQVVHQELSLAVLPSVAAQDLGVASLELFLSEDWLE